jgi:hypothetical protein
MDGRTARNHFAITPSDTAAIYADKLYVGGAGNVTCLDRDGTSAVYTAVPAGGYIYTQVTKVMSTGTTATAIVGLLY